jgi:hypothetical protein
MSQTLDPLNEGTDNHHGGEGESVKNGRSNSGERNKLAGGGGQILLQLNGNGTAMEQQPILKKRDQNGNLARRSTDCRCSTKVDFEEIVSSF